MTGISLIAGLGNPGSQYTTTRHNVGFWFIEKLQKEYNIHFNFEKKFKAETGVFTYQGRNIRVVVPNTFMNLSGQSIAPLASFYRIDPEKILVVHDELDLAPGVARLKIGGGHGGHNGLRDIVSRLGSKEFLRLRIGIGHPGSAKAVSGYVLKKPTITEQRLIEQSLDEAIGVSSLILDGDYPIAMNKLHTESNINGN